MMNRILPDVSVDSQSGGARAVRAELPPPARRERTGRLAVSFAQQRLWFLAQMEGGSRAHHIPLYLILQGDLDRITLRRALGRVIERHEALRTTFAQIDGEAFPQIASVEDSRFHLVEYDLRQHGNAQVELDRLVAEEAGTSFNLEVGPLIRGRLIRRSQDEHILLITMHHMVSDGWSAGILQKELTVLYGAFLRNEADPVPQLGLQYADYAEWQRKWIQGDILRQQADYWANTLTGAPGLLELPRDHARQAQQNFAGAFQELILDAELTAGLKALSRRHRTTLFMTLLAGWAALLARLSGGQDVVTGTPVANRGYTEIEGLIGCFVNTLVLRLDLSGSPTVGGLLERVKAQVLAAQRNQDIPFEQVVERMQPVRSLASSPLFQVMFSWLNYPRNTASTLAPGLTQALFRGLPHTTAMFDLTLFLQEEGGEIVGGLEYATSLFERSTMERYVGYFRTLLEAMAADDAQVVDRLPILSAGERHRVLYEWTDTLTEYPSGKCVYELFEEQAATSPDAFAAVFEDDSLSYAELNARANRLAHYFRMRGMKPDARVAICVERGLEMIVALLAVLKAGGAYVPLDPGYPVERLRYMLEDSGPVALLTQGHLLELFTGISDTLPVIDLNDGAIEWGRLPESNPDRDSIGLTTSHLAYVIYTSGSTGNPKGVAIEHGSLTNLICSMQQSPGISATDTLLAVTTFAFDIAALEIYLPLTKGARIIVASREASADGALLMRQLERGVTLMQATPTSWRMLLEAGWKGASNLKVLCGGEALSLSLARSLTERSSSSWNMYGPTETTIWSVIKDVTHIQDVSSIGRPIANTRVYILDAHGEPVPLGVAGELYIGGAGVARGYLNRPELTAERFLKDPFAADAAARMYRTGDLARWLGDSNIEFLGRNDFQVKIRGFRIELGEIEARLAEHPAVHEAVVIAREDTPGDQRLVAYYTASGTGDSELDPLSVESLRAHLSEKLPEYMVPAAYVRLEFLPRTPNGKLDRKALPAPDGDAYAVRGYEAPRGEIETQLAQIWADLLKLGKIGRYDNFFELGGHSLLAVRVVTRLQQALRLEVAMRDLFAHPVLADLARSLETAAHSVLPLIAHCERGKKLPLSFAQQRLWFLAQMEGVGHAYHISTGLHLRGELNHAALRCALDRIVARHEALRTTFPFIDGEPVQQIADSGKSRFRLIEHDLRQHRERQAELDRITGIEGVTCFDLETGPLIRGRLIRLAEDEHALLITMHHIVSDAWSMGLLVNELSALYGAFLQGKDDPLPELEIQYADYAVWQRKWIQGAILQRQAAYWKTNLSEAPALLEVPGDHPRPPQQSYAGSFAELVLDEQLTVGLKQLSRRHGATLYMTLLAGWAGLLARLSGQLDLVIGSPAANRGRAEIENLIGVFVNTLAIRLDLSGSPTVSELLVRTKAQALAAQQHQDIPFEQVVELAHPVRNLAHSPVFQGMFVWQNKSEGSLQLPGLTLHPLPLSPHRVAKFDLTLFLQEAGQSITGGIEYATALFERATVERYLGYLRTLLEAMVADDTQPFDRLPMLGSSELHRVLYQWNETSPGLASD